MSPTSNLRSTSGLDIGKHSLTTQDFRTVSRDNIGLFCVLSSCVVSIIGSPPARARITVSVFYPLTQVGKRRGGSKLALKTGMVAKKQKVDPEVQEIFFPDRFVMTLSSLVL